MVEKGLDTNFQQSESGNAFVDLSLREGEKFTLNIAGVTTGKPKAAAAPKKLGGGLKKLAPPPGSKRTAPSNDLILTEKPPE